MFATEFKYQKAKSVAEAIQLLGDNSDSKIIAGGHSLLPLMKLRLARPSMLIDIGGIDDLRGISVDRGMLRIGALTTHAEIAGSEAVRSAAGILWETAYGIGDPQVRNRGTIGGNVTHADPASDLPTVLTVMNARFTIQGKGGLMSGGSRTVSAEDFFQGAFTTAVGENEILTSVEMPVLAENQYAEYAKMAHPATSFAVVGAGVVVTMDDHTCTAARVAVGGLTPSPTRGPSVEQALVGQRLTAETIAASTALISQDLGDDLIGDIFASAEYRSAMAAIELKHAIFHATGLAHH
ncbi:MAG: xanthine dehydrogenase family protein subunit M [Chloroflexi bacterium]|nr:xanthine dehydrogenase family protein subunit M [Chloroflexota bacterium]MDA1271245.1 xanthine dehydrogenase family protein subunit M [Chloroflexota bacterium]